MSGEHVPVELLNDHAEGLLDPANAAVVERHLAICPRCADTADAVRSLRAEAGALPRRIDPGTDLRPGIRAERARRAAAASRREALRSQRVPLAAAAVLLVAATATLTTLVVRSDSGAAGPPTEAAATAGPPTEAAATILALDREYARAGEELRRAVEAASAELPPETARLLRSNVEAVERALAQSRAALLDDPGSPVLRELVMAAHRQRLDVLRQAAAVSPSQQEAS